MLTLLSALLVGKKIPASIGKELPEPDSYCSIKPTLMGN